MIDSDWPTSPGYCCSGLVVAPLYHWLYGGIIAVMAWSVWLHATMQQPLLTLRGESTTHVDASGDAAQCRLVMNY